MDQPISSALLEKYLNNICTAQEKELVEIWYASLQGKNNFLDSLSDTEQLRLKQDTYAYIRKKLDEPKKAQIKTVAFRWLAGVAASLLFITGFYYFFPSKTKISETIAFSKNTESSVVNFENDESRIIMHRLPDGTVVWMHSDASISYPKKFTGKQRVVNFKGEGFFDVAHDKQHPFIVKSGDLDIKVLGTKFNVKAASRQRIFEISVVSGSVSVSAADQKSVSQKVILKPRQQAFFEPLTKRLSTSQIPEQAKKEMYEPVTVSFDATELRTVVEQLNKRFDTQIHLINSGMAGCRLTADFEQQPLPFILDMLCTSLDATYTMSGKLILIDGAVCN